MIVICKKGWLLLLVIFFYAEFDFLCYTVSINDRKKKEKPYGKSDDRKRYSKNKRRNRIP